MINPPPMPKSPAINPTKIPVTDKVKISAHAKNIWNKVHETLEDSPLKDFFLKKHD
jgi:hypothetical protein